MESADRLHHVPLELTKRRLFEEAQANGQMSQGSFTPAETDAFGVVVVEDFEGVAVEDGDDLAGEVGSEYGGDAKDAWKERPDREHGPSS